MDVKETKIIRSRIDGNGLIPTTMKIWRSRKLAYKLDIRPPDFSTGIRL